MADITVVKQSLASKVNDWIALKITNIVGTMWCAYAFAILVLFPLFYPQSNTVVQYVSSAFLQLILLPLIMVGQNVLNRSSEARAKRDHKMIREELAAIKTIVEDNKQMRATIEALAAKLS